MKAIQRVSICLFAGLLAGCASMISRLPYPATRTVAQVDNLHGTQVPDPYRWLEDDNAPETKAWVEAQNQVTFDYLNKLPERERIKHRLTQLWNYEKHTTPFRQGGRYFFSHNDGLQNQNVIYTSKTLDATPAVLLDPNTLSKDGTVALMGYEISDDGKRMAYGLSSAGSDWQEWRVRDVETGKDLEDRIEWVKFSGASWSLDGSGFYYSRFDPPKAGDTLKGANRFHKIYHHRIGTTQGEDRLIYSRPDKDSWLFSGGVTDDGRYLVIPIREGTDTRNRVYYMSLEQPDSKVVELLDDFDANYTFLGNDGPLFWFKTDLKAPKGRIIQVDIRSPARSEWKELVAEGVETMTGASVVGDCFVVNYLKDAYSEVRMYGLDGKFLRKVDLPGIGSAGGFSGRRADREAFYSFASFTVPTTIFRYDFGTLKSSVLRQPKVAFDPADYETRQVFYPSKDGTRIPMFLVHKKGLKLNGRNPVYLYGYGGFNISMGPSFSPALPVWMEMGGVYALANIRGGGEYGEAWHQAGMKASKQNVFDDFIAAAEWLIANHYTSSKRLAIAGGSNGGLLVGACITQRPDLFGAAIPAVGVMDMLRFHKFTIGWAWTSDYGSPDNAQDFKTLIKYSPYHNLRPGTRYPATLVTTADHDDRVVPAHSFKFAAALQAAQSGRAPVLIRIESRAGHGAGKPTTKLIEETAERYAFLIQALGVKLPLLP